MDLLESGSDGEPRLQRVLRRRSSGGLVAAVAVAALVTGAGAVAAIGPVRAAAEQVVLEAEVRGVVAVRPRGRDGVLLVDLRNRGRRDVELLSVTVAGTGVEGGTEPGGRRVASGERARIVVPFAAPPCGRGPGRIVVRAASVGGSVTEVVPALREGLDDVVGGACGPAAGIALRVRGVGGDRGVVGDVVRGTVQLELRNEGAAVGRLRVHAEVPGVVFSTTSVPAVAAGAAVPVQLDFEVPSCAALRRTGRVAVVVEDPALGVHELGFRVTEDEEARTLRDVDLEVVHRSCRRGRPVG